jgi:hypothetical protein
MVVDSRVLFSRLLLAVLMIDFLWSIDVAVAHLLGFHPIGGT